MYCHTVKSLWTQLDNYFWNVFSLHTLTPYTNLFGIFNDSSIAESISPINHTMLIFKPHVYKSHKKHSLNLHYIIASICAINTIEKGIASVDGRKSKN